MNQSEFKSAEESIQRLRHCCQSLQSQMGQVLIGQSEVIRLLLTGLMAGGHMLVIGVPGLAKTMMVKALADLLGWEFRRIQQTRSARARPASKAAGRCLPVLPSLCP